jgi:hypothetical protein
MLNVHKVSGVGGLLLGVSLLACGSSGLKQRVNDGTLADIPMAEKQSILAAKATETQLQEERSIRRARLDMDNRDISLAQDMLQQAKLDVNRAHTHLDWASKRGEINNNAQQEQLRVAKLGVDTAQARLDALKKRREVDAAELRAVKANLRVARASCELAKAQVATQWGRAPGPGKATVGDYQNQLMDAQRHYDQISQDAQRRQSQATESDQRFAQLAAQYNWRRDHLVDTRPQFVAPGAAVPSEPQTAEPPPPPMQPQPLPPQPVQAQPMQPQPLPPQPVQAQPMQPQPPRPMQSPPEQPQPDTNKSEMAPQPQL